MERGVFRFEQVVAGRFDSQSFSAPHVEPDLAVFVARKRRLLRGESAWNLDWFEIARRSMIGESGLNGGCRAGDLAVPVPEPVVGTPAPIVGVNEPEPAVEIFGNRRDRMAGIGGFGDDPEATGYAHRDVSELGADPEPARGSGIQRGDAAGRQALRGFVENVEIDAVEAHQPGHRGQPQEAGRVLRKRRDVVARQPLGHPPALEMKIAPGRMGRGRQRQCRDQDRQKSANACDTGDSRSSLDDTDSVCPCQCQRIASPASVWSGLPRGGEGQIDLAASSMRAPAP